MAYHRIEYIHPNGEDTSLLYYVDLGPSNPTSFTNRWLMALQDRPNGTLFPSQANLSRWSISVADPQGIPHLAEVTHHTWNSYYGTWKHDPKEGDSQ